MFLFNREDVQGFGEHEGFEIGSYNGFELRYFNATDAIGRLPSTGSEVGFAEFALKVEQFNGVYVKE